MLVSYIALKRLQICEHTSHVKVLHFSGRIQINGYRESLIPPPPPPPPTKKGKQKLVIFMSV